MSLIKSEGSRPHSDPFESLRKAATNVGATTKVITLVLDVSGSMRGKAIDDLRDAASGVCARYRARVKFEAVTFASSSRRMTVLDFNSLQAGGSTAMHYGLRELLQAPTGSHAVLMSDGRPDSDSLALDEARKLAERKIVVHTVACGESADEELLRRIAEITGGAFYQAAGSFDLPVAFEQLVSKAVAALTSGTPQLVRPMNESTDRTQL